MWELDMNLVPTLLSTFKTRPVQDCYMLKGGLVLIWELDMNLVPTLVVSLKCLLL